ncbi:MAG: hypothetical protein PHC61_04435 [Chitinivibrionales bacterium]|nr:hypothetical protein [Chitinivibrionales bacterium]
MSLEKIDNPGFVYIAYRRKDHTDFDVFKSTLDASIKQDQAIQNIVIDLTRDKMLTEGEIALIAKAIQRLQGTSRCLRIVACKEIARKLESTNLLIMKNIIAYLNHESLLQDLNKNCSVVSDPVLVTDGQ